MRVEEIFRVLDLVLRLDKMSNLAVLILSAVSIYIFSLFLLLLITNADKYNNISGGKNNEGSRHYILSSILLMASLLMMFYGLIGSIGSLVITNVLVLGLSMYVLTLIYMFLKPFNGKQNSLMLLLFYINTILFATVFASKVLINGIDAAETTTDVLQIWFEKHFYFSRHAGWYDLAPIDAILKNFLMNIFGVDYPYDPLTTTLMYIALAISFVVGLFATVKKMGFKDPNSYALAILLSISNAYTLLLGMSTPPTNFSLVFSMLAVFLIAGIAYDSSEVRNVKGSFATIFTLLTVAAILAHPMAIIIPSYIIGILLYLTASRKHGSQKAKLLFLLLLISFSVFSLKAVYTGLREGLAGTIRLIMTAFAELLLMGAYRDVQAFPGSPVAPPKSVLISYTALPALLAAIFTAELVKKLRRRVTDTDDLTLFTITIPLLFILIGFIVTFLVPYSRYTAVPAVTLGAFLASIYLLRLRMFRSRNLEKLLLAILIGLMALVSALSPNALIEQYNLFTGGRWPRVENFILSKYVFDHVDLQYVTAAFTGTEKAKLHLYFASDILLYGHPAHHISVLIVERLLIPGIINTRSYWDFVGRHFLAYEWYYDELNMHKENIVFNGWKWMITWY